ncbi:hypothetical protein N9N46_02720 [Candidatus Pelagibacter ubique]|nr:hypothetical protein [Candidatus Pelagibacter ubique]
MNVKNLAIIVFNRPELTEKVMLEIKKAKPENFFIIADGPRSKNKKDEELCKETLKKVLKNINWACNVYKNVSEKNLGCKKRVVSGLNWVFSKVEDCVILEDDTIPSQSFFSYCSELLEKYRNNNSIGLISGDNFLFNKVKVKESYYFSKYCHIWGWATWKRVWSKYDADVTFWPSFKENNLLNQILDNNNEIIKCKKNFQDVFDEKIDTWDYQLTLMFWKEKLLSIMPNKNLVSNIGFGLDATHTKSINYMSNMKHFDIEFPLAHPTNIDINIEADNFKSLLFNKQTGIREKITSSLSRIINF